ncbi:MAG: winged helix-turn-helix domain-containing protein [Candidatus Bathyarchaeota archaeon]|jgi:DNA-binding HxlR family transcriptional regulator
MEDIRAKFRVLSKKHTLEMIKHLMDGPLYISQISNTLGIPYTTAQQRVVELERAGLVRVEATIDEASKRAVKIVNPVNFRLEISPRSIYNWLTEEE